MVLLRSDHMLRKIVSCKEALMFGPIGGIEVAMGQSGKKRNTKLASGAAPRETSPNDYFRTPKYVIRGGELKIDEIRRAIRKVVSEREKKSANASD